MEEKKCFTPYDEMMQTRELQMLKTIVPYMAGRAKQSLAFLIQYMEWKNTWNHFADEGADLCACEVPEGTDRRMAILTELKPFCNAKEQETIDTFINLFCIMDNYDLFLHS